MLCLNYLNKTVELLFILYNFAIVPSVGTGIKAYIPVEDLLAAIIVPFMGMGIKSRAITERWIWRVKAVWLPLSASSK